MQGQNNTVLPLKQPCVSEFIDFVGTGWNATRSLLTDGRGPGTAEVTPLDKTQIWVNHQNSSYTASTDMWVIKNYDRMAFISKAGPGWPEICLKLWTQGYVIAPTILEASWKRNGTCKSRGFVWERTQQDQIRQWHLAVYVQTLYLSVLIPFPPQVVKERKSSCHRLNLISER